MDTWDRFTEPKPSPSKEVFYSKLSDAHISEDDFTHTQKVWATFGCKTLGDYSNLYSRTCFWQMSLRRSGICASASTA